MFYFQNGLSYVALPCIYGRLATGTQRITSDTQVLGGTWQLTNNLVMWQRPHVHVSFKKTFIEHDQPADFKYSEHK